MGDRPVSSWAPCRLAVRTERRGPVGQYQLTDWLWLQAAHGVPYRSAM